MPINRESLRYLLGLDGPAYEREDKNALLHLAVALAHLNDSNAVCTLADVVFFDDSPANIASAKTLLERQRGEVVDLSMQTLFSKAARDKPQLHDELATLQRAQKDMQEAQRGVKTEPNNEAFGRLLDEKLAAYQALEAQFKHDEKQKQQLIKTIKTRLDGLLKDIRHSPQPHVNKVLCFDWGGVLSECFSVFQHFSEKAPYVSEIYSVGDDNKLIFDMLRELKLYGVKFVNASNDAGREEMYAARLDQLRACPYSYAATLGNASVYRLFTLAQTLLEVLKQEGQESQFQEIMIALINSAKACPGSAGHLDQIDAFHAVWIETQSGIYSEAVRPILDVLHRSLASCKAIAPETFKDLDPHLQQPDLSAFMRSTTAKQYMIPARFCEHIKQLVTDTCAEMRGPQRQAAQAVQAEVQPEMPADGAFRSLSHVLQTMVSRWANLSSYDDMVKDCRNSMSASANEVLSNLGIISKPERENLKKEDYWQGLSPEKRTELLSTAVAMEIGRTQQKDQGAVAHGRMFAPPPKAAAAAAAAPTANEVTRAIAALEKELGLSSQEARQLWHNMPEVEQQKVIKELPSQEAKSESRYTPSRK